jgi:hypothetical protein
MQQRALRPLLAPLFLGFWEARGPGVRLVVAYFAVAAVVAHCSAGRMGGRPPVLSPRGFARVMLHANSTRLLDPLAEGVAKSVCVFVRARVCVCVRARMCVCVCVCVCVV